MALGTQIDNLIPLELSEDAEKRVQICNRKVSYLLLLIKFQCILYNLSHKVKTLMYYFPPCFIHCRILTKNITKVVIIEVKEVDLG